MGTKTQAPYNHQADSVDEATGLNIDDMQTRLDNLVDRFNETKPESLSQIAESIENEFSHRELAVIQASDLMRQSSQSAMSEILHALVSKD